MVGPFDVTWCSANDSQEAVRCTLRKDNIRKVNSQIVKSQLTDRKVNPQMRWRQSERERVLIDNLLVRIHRCFSWTGLAPWEFEFPFPGSLISTSNFLV